MCQFVTKDVDLTGMLVSIFSLQKILKIKTKNILIHSDNYIFDKIHTYYYLT
ncbi:protein of unknown function [Shewanella benthica]|uniref:Uncharacterized protein n=1 Tax=Shewanella benthica TaxID=43661 RepID=A0A330M052_9GAMM|nr:protein of unknown function [Shewanella benthica]